MPVQYNSCPLEIELHSYNGAGTPGRSENNPPGESGNMKPKGLRSLRNSEGKGFLGCVVALVLFGVAVYLGIVLGPIYYSNFNFEAEVKTTASRAGARFFDDEAIIKEIMDMAKRNEIRLERQNIKVDRFAGKLHIVVNYSVPVDFVLFEHDVSFNVDAVSLVGTL